MKSSYPKTAGPVKRPTYHIMRGNFMFTMRGTCRVALAWYRIIKTLPSAQEAPAWH